MYSIVLHGVGQFPLPTANRPTIRGRNSREIVEWERDSMMSANDVYFDEQWRCVIASVVNYVLAGILREHPVLFMCVICAYGGFLVFFTAMEQSSCRNRSSRICLLGCRISRTACNGNQTRSRLVLSESVTAVITRLCDISAVLLFCLASFTLM